MGAKPAEEAEKYNWHWRNTMRPVRFFGFDARAAIPFAVLLFYARISTIILTIVITMIFWFLEQRGFTFPAAMRALRAWLCGQNRPAWIRHRHRKMRDFG